MNKKIVKTDITKILFVAFNMFYLIYSLAIPWFNSAIYIILKESRKEEILANISILAFYFFLIFIMYIANKYNPNPESFKEKIRKEFLSQHNLLKSMVIYVISIAFLSSNNPSFGIALLIPYYMFVINFYTSISSGEIKQGWF